MVVGEPCLRDEEGDEVLAPLYELAANFLVRGQTIEGEHALDGQHVHREGRRSRCHGGMAFTSLHPFSARWFPLSLGQMSVKRYWAVPVAAREPEPHQNRPRTDF